MKTTLWMTAMVAGLALTGAGATAQSAAPDAQPPAGHAPMGPDFAALDANGDGALTLEEMQAQAASRFAAADTDGDGGLSVTELEAQAAQRRADRFARMLADRDANGDGLLQLEEMRPEGGDRLEAMFARLDADADGTVSAAEFAAARENMGPRGAHDRRGSHGRHGEHGDHGRKHRG